MAMRASRGFTLMEMLVVLTIIGILAGFGFPAMTKFLTTQSVRSAAYDLFADLIYARSEAISRGVTVSIIGNAATNFKQGWAVRENAGGTVIRTQPSRDSAINFTSSVSTITFDRNGRAQSPVEVTFTIVPVETTANDYMKRCIRLDPSGRPRSSEGACV
jgi:prepilin-type N-terminal cleavage/methylation domain-containing protein